MIGTISSILMVTGAVVAVIAGLGLLRFRTTYTRFHAASKPATLGVALVLGGAALQAPEAGTIIKLLLIVVLQFITAPVASHLMSRSSYRAGTRVEGPTQLDELHGVEIDD